MSIEKFANGESALSVRNKLNAALAKVLSDWVLTQAYDAGELVLRQGKAWLSNDAVPANTAFAVGTTGATWRRAFGVIENSVSVTAGQTVNVPNIDIKQIQQVILTFNELNVLTPVGTIDPTNVSTNEANLIDGIYTNLAYNNSSSGSANKELPAVDLGADTAVTAVVVYWWNNTYTASDYKIQGSTDGTSWTDLATGLDSTGLGGQSQTTAITGTYRYFRVFCVTGNNASFCILSEMEIIGAPLPPTVQINNDEVEVTQNGTGVDIYNGTTLDRTVNLLT